MISFDAAAERMSQGPVPVWACPGTPIDRPWHLVCFIVQRPKVEPGYRLDRTETSDRRINYTLYAYAAEKPHGARYQDDDKGPDPN